MLLFSEPVGSKTMKIPVYSDPLPVPKMLVISESGLWPVRNVNPAKTGISRVQTVKTVNY